MTPTPSQGFRSCDGEFPSNPTDRNDDDNNKISARCPGVAVVVRKEIAVRNGPLRYAPRDETQATSDELGFFRLRYKVPGETTTSPFRSHVLGLVGVPHLLAG